MPRLRTAAALAAAALTLVPAVAAGAPAGDDPAQFPAGQLLPFRLEVTPSLATGGSTITLRIRAVATGNQGFQTPVSVIACVGAAGCKTGRVPVNRPGASLTLQGFPLTGTVSGPYRVGLQVVGCSVGFRCASVVRSALAR
jgi:hypothetical protein